MNNNLNVKLMTLVIFSFCCFFNTAVYSAQISKQVKASVKSRVQFGLLNGLVIALVNKDGVEYFSYGVTSADEGALVDENTIFEIGSISKVFTASLLADAEQRGEVHGKDTINKYLSLDLRNRNLDVITLNALANHHSGLPTMPDNFSPSEQLNPYQDYSASKLYDYLLQLKSSELLPDTYQYSNTGMGLLGHSLELATKQSYSQLIETRITKKLGMHNTYIGLPEVSMPLAKGHNGGEVPNWTFDVLVGAGGILSSAHDMALFLNAQFKSNDEVLTQAFSKTRTVSKVDIYEHTNIGLGWFIVDQSSGENIIYHDGNTNGYWSFAGFLEDGSKAVVVLSNSGTENINDIGFHLLNAANALQTAPSYTEINLSTNELKKYQGTYTVPMV